MVSVAAALLPEQLTRALDDVAKKMSSKYNCSISIAFKTASGEAVAARGIADFSTQRQASTNDVYAWGSITKMLTAASILKLVSQGAFELDDPVPPLVNPIIARMAKSNPKQNFTSVEELWGSNIKKTTVRQLLSMQSGVPDFDTATPQRGGVSTDSLRKELYRNPDHFYSPAELMNVPWVRGQWVNCKRKMWPVGPKFCYSSTNFMLLGLILASHTGAATPNAFDQASFLPKVLRGQMQFALKGAPVDYGAAHGYDRTPYNMPVNQTNDHDDSAVDGVFAGWTASNIVANASVLANLAWEIYGPPSSIAKKPYIDQMIPKNGIYGLGTFNLGWLTGQHQSLGIGYGHLGATYGYQSLAGYFPDLKIAMSIASNIETFNQAQPSETFCHGYNAAVGILLGKNITCEFKTYSFYGGFCACEAALKETSMFV